MLRRNIQFLGFGRVDLPYQNQYDCVNGHAVLFVLTWGFGTMLEIQTYSRVDFAYDNMHSFHFLGITSIETPCPTRCLSFDYFGKDQTTNWLTLQLGCIKYKSTLNQRQFGYKSNKSNNKSNNQNKQIPYNMHPIHTNIGGAGRPKAAPPPYIGICLMHVVWNLIIFIICLMHWLIIWIIWFIVWLLWFSSKLAWVYFWVIFWFFVWSFPT